MKTFRNNDGKGFQITFPNGVTLSTQFGWSHYCENYDHQLPLDEAIAKTDWESDTAEIAMFLPDGEWITKEFEFSGDDVIGHVKIDKWLKAVEFCRDYIPKAAALGPGEGK